MKDKLDTWCVNANHALSGNNNGSTKICCMHTDYEKDMQLGVETIDQCFNKEEIRNIRQSLNNGVRHKACRLCWEEEDAGRYSKRLRDNERYQSSVQFENSPVQDGILCNFLFHHAFSRTSAVAIIPCDD